MKATCDDAEIYMLSLTKEHPHELAVSHGGNCHKSSAESCMAPGGS